MSHVRACRLRIRVARHSRRRQRVPDLLRIRVPTSRPVQPGPGASLPTNKQQKHLEERLSAEQEQPPSADHQDRPEHNSQSAGSRAREHHLPHPRGDRGADHGVVQRRRLRLLVPVSGLLQ